MCLPSRCPEMALVYLPISQMSHSNGSTCYIAPSLGLFVLNAIQAYCHLFFSMGCAWSHLPPCALDCSVYSPTATSLWPLIPSRSLISCKLVQVYHHQPRSRSPLDPVYHIIYLGYYLVWAPWAPPQGLEFERFPLCVGWAIDTHSVMLMVAKWSTKFAVLSILGCSVGGGGGGAKTR
jgi:hypothetical protein